MASETVRDIITRVRGMHIQLASYYQSMGDAAARERVKMLLYYVSRHERNLEAALRQYQEQAGKQVLGTWFKATPAAKMEQSVLNKDMGTDDVIRLVLEADQKMVSQFRQLSESAASEEVRDLFQKLIAIEEREEQQLVRDAEELEDV